MIEVNLHHSSWYSYFPNCEQFVEKVISVVIAEFQNSSVSVMMSDSEFVRNINLKYRGIDRSTDVLSFPYQGDFSEGFLGDIVLALEVILFEASEKNLSIQEHTTHILIHGCLHLFGYDHDTDAEATVMEEKEQVIMRKLGYKNFTMNS